MLTVKKISLLGFLAVIALAAAWAGLTYTLNFLSPNHYALIHSLGYVFLIGLFMSVTALIIGKSGSVLIFSLAGGVFTYLIPQITNNGTYEIAMLFTAALAFEIILLLAKRTSLSLIIATVVASATIPVVLLLIVGQFGETLLKATINFSMLCAIVGFMASMLALGIWECIKTKKFIIKIRVLS